MSNQQSGSIAGPRKEYAQSHRFFSPEFVAYEVIIAISAVHLITASYQLSRQFQPGGEFSRILFLYKGWVPGFHNDLSDIQWRLYRKSLPALASVLALWVVISRTVQAHFKTAHPSFVLVTGIGLIFALHGYQALHVLFSLMLHYSICRLTAGRRWIGPISFWLVPGVIWLAARTFDGLPFSMFASALKALDANKGLVRWQIGFNLVILRMISWAFDLHWTRLRQRGYHTGFETNAPSHAYVSPPTSFGNLTQKERQLVHHREDYYGAAPFLQYCLYPPLYLTGPTITFNDFICQVRCTQHVQVMSVVKYGLRVLLSLLLLELLTHTLYVNAFGRFKVWERLGDRSEEVFTPTVLASLAFFKLIFLWLKFLVIWRVARFFALADGIDPPENMLRCVCNNYDISGFWRNWHASYNKWLVRYMYIPMGGSKWRLLNVWLIFTFVAMWHDLDWHLLRWAWLMAFFLAPEILCKSIINRPAWKRHWRTAWFTHLCAAFAAFYITIMMAVNLIGYGFGSGGVIHVLQRVISSWGLTVGMLASFYAAAHIMFEIRRLESERQSKHLRTK